VAKLAMSNAAFLSCVRKLNIQPGDILLVKSLEVAEQLSQAPTPGFVVPIIFDPSNAGLEKLTRQQLLDALEKLDEISAT
jgi:hypothetical protein